MITDCGPCVGYTELRLVPTKLSPPGPDGGIDIFAGRGPFGLDAPRLCVQVKSQNSPADRKSVV